MRLLLAAAALCLCACGDTRVVRTVHEASDDGGRHLYDVVEPTYDKPQRLVYVAALRCARAYFHGKEIRETPPAHLELDDDEFWYGGSMHVWIDVVALDDGHARVEMSAQGYGANRPMGAKSAATRRFRVYYERLDAEMRTIDELRAELAQPTAAGTPDEDGARGASATSRP